MSEKLTPKEKREIELLQNYTDRREEKINLINTGIQFLRMDELDGVLRFLREATQLDLLLTIKKLD